MPRVSGIPRVRFNLRSKADKHAPTLITATFRYSNNQGDQRVVISTQESIEPKHWDSKAKKPRPNYDAYSDVTESLLKVEKAFRDVYRAHRDDLPDKDFFKREVNRKLGREDGREDDKAPTLLQFVEQYVNERRYAPGAKKGTWQRYRNARNLLNAFVDEERAGNLDYRDVNWKFRDDFVNWLYAPPRKHSKAHASKTLKCVKHFVSVSRKRGYHDNTIPSERGYGIGTDKIEKVILSFDEIDKLWRLNLTDNPRLERVRDLFLIGCWSGLRISDFQRIKPENIVKDDGVELLQVHAQKTGQTVYVPMLPELRVLLEKYNWQSPKAISNQKFNEYLKELCKLAELDTPTVEKYSEAGVIMERTRPKYDLITSHTARRSWASNFYRLGIGAGPLMAITGHTTEAQFFGYINISNRDNAKDMAAKLKGFRATKSRLRVV